MFSCWRSSLEPRSGSQETQVRTVLCRDWPSSPEDTGLAPGLPFTNSTLELGSVGTDVPSWVKYWDSRTLHSQRCCSSLLSSIGTKGLRDNVLPQRHRMQRWGGPPFPHTEPPTTERGLRACLLSTSSPQYLHSSLL